MKILSNIAEWIGDDYRSHPLRFVVEMLAWAMSIGANLMFAIMVPNVPFLIYLSITVAGCAMYAWSAWNRGSFGMLANYMLLTAIDIYALFNLLSSGT